jgi:hypothetical protein
MTALFTAMVACVCLLSLRRAPLWAAADTITEFPHSSRLGGPDGNLWFAESLTSQIGRITKS